MSQSNNVDEATSKPSNGSVVQDMMELSEAQGRGMVAEASLPSAEWSDPQLTRSKADLAIFVF